MTVLSLMKTASTLESSHNAMVLPKQMVATDGVPQQMWVADGSPNGLEGLEDGTGLESHPTDRVATTSPQGGTLLRASSGTGKYRPTLDHDTDLGNLIRDTMLTPHSRWALNPGGMPPTGSTGIQVNSSNLPPVDMTPPDGPFDDDNPLQFPPWDNSTGVWLTYAPGNITGNLTHELEAADCIFARDHGTGGYHQSCQTNWGGGKSMQVRITVSGTGYVQQHLPGTSFSSDG